MINLKEIKVAREYKVGENEGNDVVKGSRL